MFHLLDVFVEDGNARKDAWAVHARKSRATGLTLLEAGRDRSELRWTVFGINSYENYRGDLGEGVKKKSHKEE